MLRKCLRYDLKSVFPYWLIGAIAMIAFSILGGIAYRNLEVNPVSAYLFRWEWIILIIVYFAFAAFVVLSSILIYLRYYNHFFSDEGYLTFTLPVKRKTLFFSKVINGVIWQSLTNLVVLLSIIIIFLFVPSTDSGSSLPSTETESLFSGLWILVYILESLILTVISSVVSVLVMYYLITVGANMVRKNKLVSTIGLIFGAGVVLYILTYVGLFGGILYTASVASLPFLNFTNYELLIFFCLALAIAIALTLAIAFAMMTLRILERKLNLA